MRELGVRVQVREVLDRPRLDAGGLQCLGDVGCPARRRPLREPALQVVDARQPPGRGREPRVRRPRGLAHGAHQPPPVLVVVHHDRDPAVLARAREDAVRRLVPRAVPHAPEDLAVGRVGDDRLGEAHDPALHLRQVDVLALAGAAAVEEGRGQQERREARRERVGDRAEGADGLAVGPAGQVIEAGERRALPAEARVVALGARLAVQARADHQQVGALLHQRGVVEPPLRHRAGREVLRHRIGPEREPARDRHPLGAREVERHGELVGVQHREVVRAVEAAGRVGREAQRAQEVGALPRLDADHGRAVVGEVARRHRAGGAAAELEDGRAGEEIRHTTPSARSRASSAAPMPSSPSTSAVCSPRRGAGRRMPIGLPLLRANAPG